MKISVVVNTYNEELNLPRCLGAVYGAVDEIVVVDMKSTDKTVKIAKQFDAKVIQHPYVGYVEPARNTGLEKAKGDWILLLDADELISEFLLKKLIALAQNGTYHFIRIPRKNIIFNRWISHTGWWPDYQIRFFKKRAVSWGDEIHSIPITQGAGFDLPIEEKNALTHYHYQTISQFLERLNRYTSIEAEELFKTDESFDPKNILAAPFHEFLSRFFAQEGYKDGLHGLSLSLLQAFSLLTLQLKLWEKHSFQPLKDEKVEQLVAKKSEELGHELHYWISQTETEKASYLQKIVTKARKRLRL